MSGPGLQKRAKRLLRYLGLRAALAAIALLPLWLALRLGEMFGLLAFALARQQRAWALESLALAFSDAPAAQRRQLARECFRHLGRCAFELACVRKLDRQLDRWLEFSLDEQEVLRRALARGKGVLFVTGHVGNWELLGRRVASAGFPVQTIARQTPDPRLAKLIERFRISGNVRTIWRGAPESAKQMLRALRSGQVLGLAIDQDTRVQSVFVPFFGHPASTPRGAADLAFKTGAAVVVGFCQRQGNGRYRLSLQEMEPRRSVDSDADAVDLTARMTEQIERTIRRSPAQWVWMHRRWKTQP